MAKFGIENILEEIKKSVKKNPSLKVNIISTNGNAFYAEQIRERLALLGIEYLERNLSVYETMLSAGYPHNFLKREGLCNGERFYDLNLDQIEFD